MLGLALKRGSEFRIKFKEIFMSKKIKCIENSYLGGRIFSAGSYYDEEEIPYVHRKDECLGFDWPKESKKRPGRPSKDDNAKKANKESEEDKEKSSELSSKTKEDNG